MRHWELMASLVLSLSITAVLLLLSLGEPKKLGRWLVWFLEVVSSCLCGWFYAVLLVVARRDFMYMFLFSQGVIVMVIVNVLLVFLFDKMLRKSFVLVDQQPFLRVALVGWLAPLFPIGSFYVLFRLYN